jgi:tRNA pseudouridine55 synthase
VDGFLNIHKPVGPTSFKIVSQVRGKTREKQVGHAGTLDPAASGVLVLALGNATRLLPYLPIEPKLYEFNLVFGIETDTLDAEGLPIKSGGAIPGEPALDAVLPRFAGMITQTPPVFSAVKINGKRAYDLARKNVPVEPKPRTVTIHEIDLVRYDAIAGVARLSVRCSSGTYVRSLARDIALALGTFGHATDILRLAVGPFTLEKSISPDLLEGNLDKALIDIRSALPHIPSKTATPGQRKNISLGRDIDLALSDSNPELILGFDESGDLIALLRRIQASRYHPEKVFLSSE